MNTVQIVILRSGAKALNDILLCLNILDEFIHKGGKSDDGSVKASIFLCVLPDNLT